MAEHWDPEEQEEETHVYLGGGSFAVMHGNAAMQRNGALQSNAVTDSMRGDTDSADHWFISRDGVAKEVLSAREIIESTRAGVLSELALVWRDGLPDWTPLGQVPELMRAVRAFVPGPNAPLPPPPRPVNLPLPPMPSLPHIGALPPVPAFVQPGFAQPAFGQPAFGQPAFGQTGQFPVAGAMPGMPAEAAATLAPEPIAFWDRIFEVPGLGPTNARAFVVFGGLLVSGIALGAMLFTSGRTPKPLVISGDISGVRELGAREPGSKETVAALRTPPGSEGQPEADKRASAAEKVAEQPRAEPAVNAVPISQIPAAPPVSPQAVSPQPAAQPRSAPQQAPSPARAFRAAEPAAPRAVAAAPAAKTGGGAEFDVEAAKTALSSAAARAARCQPKGGPTGTGSVRVTLAPAGNVTSVEITTPKFEGSTTAGCVQMVFRQARVPAFSGSERTVNKKFTIPDPED